MVEGCPVVRVADVHAGALSNCLKAFENLDAGCGVIV
jgi:hypothetical protein